LGHEGQREAQLGGVLQQQQQQQQGRREQLVL
jgi:hypothetical protein